MTDHPDLFRRNDPRVFPNKVRALAFERCEGRCEFVDDDGVVCGVRCTPGNTVYDHIVPWEISHDSQLSNCQVLCKAHDKLKTARDKGTIAKSNHQRDKHIGAKLPSKTPLPCGKNTSRSKTFRHGIVPRKTQGEKLRDTQERRKVGP